MPPPPEAWNTARTIYPGCPMYMEYRVDVRGLVAAGLVPPEAAMEEQIVCITVLPRAGGQHATPPPGIPIAFGHQVEGDEKYWVMQNATEDVAFAASKIKTIVLFPVGIALQQTDCPADIVAMASARQAQCEGEDLATMHPPAFPATEEPATEEPTEAAMAATGPGWGAADATTDTTTDTNGGWGAAACAAALCAAPGGWGAAPCAAALTAPGAEDGGLMTAEEVAAAAAAPAAANGMVADTTTAADTTTDTTTGERRSNEPQS